MSIQNGRYRSIIIFLTEGVSQKTKSLMTEGRNLYTSRDESVVLETIVPGVGSNEFVYTVSIQPDKDKRYLLCKEIEKQ